MTNDGDPPDEIQKFVAENLDLLIRLLKHGSTEARGYALTALANGGRPDDVEQVRQEIEKVQEDNEE